MSKRIYGVHSCRLSCLYLMGARVENEVLPVITEVTKERNSWQLREN